jgi:hypothetical protein
VLRLDPTRANGSSGDGTHFVLYIEGPADRGILRGWSYRLLPDLGRRLFDGSVILGGRRPARALAHFRGVGGAASGARALCVLDRDDGTDEQQSPGEPGLEFFTWSRRHIESYLLVPAAIRRALAPADDDGRIERLLRQHLPPNGDERAYRDVDAKRLLGPSGVLSRALGRPLALSRIARATRETELHADVHALFARLRDAVGSTAARR